MKSCWSGDSPAPPRSRGGVPATHSCFCFFESLFLVFQPSNITSFTTVMKSWQSYVPDPEVQGKKKSARSFIFFFFLSLVAIQRKKEKTLSADGERRASLLLLPSESLMSLNISTSSFTFLINMLLVKSEPSEQTILINV